MKNSAMLAELLELITTDAASGQETDIAAKLAAKLRALGFTVTSDRAGETFGGACGNLFGVLEGTLPGSLLLSSHMDRVPNGLGIRPVERDGVLYSDGTTILAADDISGVCAILDGLRRVLAAGIALPRLEVVFSVGEEAGLYGAKAADMSWFQSKLGYIFDSPGPVGRFVNAAPGRYQLGAEITGLAAHAGNEPEKGIDAARILCEMLSTLKQGRLDEVTTSNFPILSTGTKVPNVVCDFASFGGEARSRDGGRLRAYVDYFETHCRAVAEKYGAGLKLTVEEAFLPFCIPEEEPVLVMAKAACDSLGISCRIDVGGGGMDANIYNASGMSTVGVATGYTKNHTKSEQLVLEDFYRSGELAAKLIETYAGFCVSE
ncbi:M20/M25/M40 family metallo-hydrolase [Oscillibacter sp.]|uniref:M20/M25/M40 family metallo-hydrolase n=1 Tax=Oscillibacter sp. TaxID=1945593 RepID=UPI0026042D55|nr:M20/M25/M40 family metallo-hydrolase [Oscillibacter sp.]MDD3347890.1 M20/M25/M40 family metallo-hydrolase [Oscillibacter sp.]